MGGAGVLQRGEQGDRLEGWKQSTYGPNNKKCVAHELSI